MDLGAKGEIHSNIPSNKVVEVININSRQTIGEVQYPVDHIFVLAGKVWLIVRESFDRIYVKPAKAGIATAKFKSHASKGAFYYLLPAHIGKPESEKWYTQDLSEITRVAEVLE
ncbi:MAG: hypothetical protein KAT13_01010 [Methanosarcinales archaeon]|nr:hypothetical protein [Methanosarcinales archaeon]